MSTTTTTSSSCGGFTLKTEIGMFVASIVLTVFSVFFLAPLAIPNLEDYLLTLLPIVSLVLSGLAMLLWILPIIRALKCNIPTPIDCLPYTSVVEETCLSFDWGLSSFIMNAIFGILSIVITAIRIDYKNKLSYILVDMVGVIASNVSPLILIAPFIGINEDIGTPSSTPSSCSWFSLTTEVHMLTLSMLSIGLGMGFLIFVSVTNIVVMISRSPWINYPISEETANGFKYFFMVIGHILSIVGMVLWFISTIAGFSCHVTTPFGPSSSPLRIVTFVVITFAGIVGIVAMIIDFFLRMPDQNKYLQGGMNSSYVLMFANVVALVLTTPFILENQVRFALNTTDF